MSMPQVAAGVQGPKSFENLVPFLGLNCIWDDEPSFRPIPRLPERLRQSEFGPWRYEMGIYRAATNDTHRATDDCAIRRRPLFNISFVAICLLVIASAAQAQLTGFMDIDISGLPTGGADPFNNEVLLVDLGTGGQDAVVNGVGHDVTITAHDPSWLSHVAFEFTDSLLTKNPAGFPGFGGDDFSGTASYSSDGIEDISMLPIPGTTETVDLSFTAPGGILALTLFEWTDDLSVAPDGFWDTPSTITVRYSYVPESGSIWLIGVGSLVLVGQRRLMRTTRSSAGRRNVAKH